jgi:DNA polymerase alpha subunit A
MAAPIDEQNIDNVGSTSQDHNMDFNDDFGDAPTYDDIKLPEDSGSANAEPSLPKVKMTSMANLRKPTLEIKSLNSAKPSMKTSKFLPKFEKEEQAKEFATVVSVAPNNNLKWTDVMGKVSVTADQPTAIQNVAKGKYDILEEDGSLYMFWIDAFEKSGLVYLFGKALQKGANNYVSVCITIHGIDRNLFVLPRQKMLDGIWDE